MNTWFLSPKKQQVIFIGAMILVLIFLPGCSMLKKITGQQPKQESQSQQEEPKQLMQIETILDKIFTDLGGPALESEKVQGQGQEDQPGQNQQNKQSASVQDPWQQVSQEIKSLHLSWNEIMPEAAKKGAKKDLIDNFSNTLNNLTKTADTKDKDKVLLSANSLYQYIPELYSLYQTKTSPELKRVNYYSRNIILNAKTGNWDKVSSDTEKLKSLWSLIKNTAGKDQQEDSAKLDLSIYELEKVVQERNKELIDIKGKIIQTNLQSLLKSMEKSGGQ
ncbi:MAG: hypothetical protein AWM53_00063 [Candidatus Dichloromethanomonas elyunquensis]|nr:MAG: hypothetical protein AWM53_00063 [Candidatus Dichloromethanomonas elyunquensis]